MLIQLNLLQSRLFLGALVEFYQFSCVAGSFLLLASQVHLTVVYKDTVVMTMGVPNFDIENFLSALLFVKMRCFLPPPRFISFSRAVGPPVQVWVRGRWCISVPLPDRVSLTFTTLLSVKRTRLQARQSPGSARATR